MSQKDQPGTETITKTSQGGQLDAAVPRPSDAASLDLARHDRVASQFISGLHALVGLLEGFGRAKRGRRTKIANYASMPDEAFEAVARGLEFSPTFTAFAQLKAEEVRDMLALSKAYGSVKGELQVVLLALEDTVAEKRGLVGERCSRAVRIGDELTLNGESQEAVLHLRQVLELFKLRRRKSPDTEREVVQTVKSIKRKAVAAVNIEVTGSQSMEPVTTQFKAGRDLEP